MASARFTAGSGTRGATPSSIGSFGPGRTVVVAMSANAAVPAVGPLPTADQVFVGALLYGATSEVRAVLRLVRDDDLESPAMGAVVAAIRRLAAASKPCAPQMVLDELRRVGQAKGHVLEQFRSSLTTGAVPEAARDYAAAVVAGSLRRRIAGAGDVLVVSAHEVAEANLAPLMERANDAIQDCAARLRQLRGDVE